MASGIAMAAAGLDVLRPTGPGAPVRKPGEGDAGRGFGAVFDRMDSPGAPDGSPSADAPDDDGALTEDVEDEDETAGDVSVPTADGTPSQDAPTGVPQVSGAVVEAVPPPAALTVAEAVLRAVAPPGRAEDALPAAGPAPSGTPIPEGRGIGRGLVALVSGQDPGRPAIPRAPQDSGPSGTTAQDGSDIGAAVAVEGFEGLEGAQADRPAAVSQAAGLATAAPDGTKVRGILARSGGFQPPMQADAGRVGSSDAPQEAASAPAPSSVGSASAPSAANADPGGPAGSTPRRGSDREERRTGPRTVEGAAPARPEVAPGAGPKPPVAMEAAEPVAPLPRKAGRTHGEAGPAIPDIATPAALHASAPSAPPASAPAEGTVARSIARQIAAQPDLVADGTAELRLAPEELGALRLSVERSGDGLRLVIEAARPETADLLRRHVEALRQELRQDGLGSVSVSIGGGDARRGHEGARAPGRIETDARTPAAGFGIPSHASAIAPVPRGRGAGGHLDLRF